MNFDDVNKSGTDTHRKRWGTRAQQYILPGSLNGKVGQFEWIVQDGFVTHRYFNSNL